MFNKRHPGRGACAYFFSPQFKYAVVCIIVFVRIKSHWLLKLCKASWMNWRLRLYRNESFFSGLQMLRWSTFTSTSSPMPRSETKPGFHISIYSTEEYLISYWRWCCIPADCFGTTTILIIGPTFVACDSAKLITLKSFSFAMFTKLSFRLDKAGESWQKWKMLVNNSILHWQKKSLSYFAYSPLQSSRTSIDGKRRYLTLTEYSAMKVPWWGTL